MFIPFSHSRDLRVVVVDLLLPGEEKYVLISCDQIFNISFCGDWAGAVWGQTACAQINPTCQGYVASQPQSFQESYWLVNSLKVYSA